MPIYEYRCDDCQQIFEEWQKNFEEKDMSCPVCGGSGKRLVSNTSFILKGSGWYVTDYAKGSKSNGNGTSPKPADKAETKTETKKQDTSTTKQSSTTS